MSSVLLLSCRDQPGIVAATSGFIADRRGNIIHAEQHVDTDAGHGTVMFFQRIEFDLPPGDPTIEEFERDFSVVADRFAMAVTLRSTDVEVPTAILASRQPHCLYDLGARWSSGQLPIDLRAVISNHPDHADYCAHLGVRHLYLPVTPQTRAAQEDTLRAELHREGVELVVLARYMQVLGHDIVKAYRHRIINIHHSFLPAFVGANPYRQAHERGVKLIGATAHYATVDLDDGPIIEQDTVHVSHRDDVSRLTAKGRDLETIVLARAVRAHVEHRVLVAGRKTVVFS
jgi:formyltetrahydrofolate deformylase